MENHGKTIGTCYFNPENMVISWDLELMKIDSPVDSFPRSTRNGESFLIFSLTYNLLKTSELLAVGLMNGDFLRTQVSLLKLNQLMTEDDVRFFPL